MPEFLESMLSMMESAQAMQPAWVTFYSDIYLVGYAIVALPTAIAWWIVHRKAGRPGWSGLIPFANLIVLSNIVGGPIWAAVLMMMTPVAPIGSLFLLPNMAKAFGKEPWMGYVCAIFPPVMFWIVAFSDAEYLGSVKEIQSKLASA